MRSNLLLCLLVVAMPGVSFAFPTMKGDTPARPSITEQAAPAAAPAAAEKPLPREEFVWKDIPTKLHHAEAAKRLTTGLGRCSQFGVETRAEETKTVYDIYFKVGENRSPWPIGRIELTPKGSESKVEIGVNRMFFRGSGKYHTMWGGYLEEKYECPPKPEKHSGGMAHP